MRKIIHSVSIVAMSTLLLSACISTANLPPGELEDGYYTRQFTEEYPNLSNTVVYAGLNGGIYERDRVLVSTYVDNIDEPFMEWLEEIEVTLKKEYPDNPVNVNYQLIDKQAESDLQTYMDTVLPETLGTPQTQVTKIDWNTTGEIGIDYIHDYTITVGYEDPNHLTLNHLNSYIKVINRYPVQYSNHIVLFNDELPAPNILKSAIAVDNGDSHYSCININGKSYYYDQNRQALYIHSAVNFRLPHYYECS